MQIRVLDINGDHTNGFDAGTITSVRKQAGGTRLQMGRQLNLDLKMTVDEFYDQLKNVRSHTSTNNGYLTIKETSA